MLFLAHPFITFVVLWLLRAVEYSSLSPIQPPLLCFLLMLLLWSFIFSQFSPHPLRLFVPLLAPQPPLLLLFRLLQLCIWFLCTLLVPFYYFSIRTFPLCSIFPTVLFPLRSIFPTFYFFPQVSFPPSTLHPTLPPLIPTDTYPSLLLWRALLTAVCPTHHRSVIVFFLFGSVSISRSFIHFVGNYFYFTW